MNNNCDNEFSQLRKLISGKVQLCLLVVNGECC